MPGAGLIAALVPVAFIEKTLGTALVKRIPDQTLRKVTVAASLLT